MSTEESMTDQQVSNLPIDERIQIALTEALGEDEGAIAYEVIEHLLAIAHDNAHLCGVWDERDDKDRCRLANPFRDGGQS